MAKNTMWTQPQIVEYIRTNKICAPIPSYPPTYGFIFTFLKQGYKTKFPKQVTINRLYELFPQVPCDRDAFGKKCASLYRSLKLLRGKKMRTRFSECFQYNGTKLRYSLQEHDKFDEVLPFLVAQIMELNSGKNAAVKLRGLLEKVIKTVKADDVEECKEVLKSSYDKLGDEVKEQTRKKKRKRNNDESRFDPNDPAAYEFLKQAKALKQAVQCIKTPTGEEIHFIVLPKIQLGSKGCVASSLRRRTRIINKVRTYLCSSRSVSKSEAKQDSLAARVDELKSQPSAWKEAIETSGILQKTLQDDAKNPPESDSFQPGEIYKEVRKRDRVQEDEVNDVSDLDEASSRFEEPSNRVVYQASASSQSSFSLSSSSSSHSTSSSSSSSHQKKRAKTQNTSNLRTTDNQETIPNSAACTNAQPPPFSRDWAPFHAPPPPPPTSASLLPTTNLHHPSSDQFAVAIMKTTESPIHPPLPLEATASTFSDDQDGDLGVGESSGEPSSDRSDIQTPDSAPPSEAFAVPAPGCSDWSEEDVLDWLRKLPFGELYLDVFREKKINGIVLPTISDQMLERIFKMKYGHILKFRNAVQILSG